MTQPPIHALAPGGAALCREQLAELRDGGARASAGGRRLAGADGGGVDERRNWAGRCSVQVGWAYLVRLDGKRRKPRPRHVQADPAEQEAFKKS